MARQVAGPSETTVIDVVARPGVEVLACAIREGPMKEARDRPLELAVVRIKP